MKTINADYVDYIKIGHDGENDAVQVVFDVDDVIKTYGPEGTFTLCVSDKYFQVSKVVTSAYDRINRKLTWDVSRNDIIPGVSLCQYTYVNNGVEAKSRIYVVKSRKSIEVMPE